MPLTRGAVARLHLEQSASPAPSPSPRPASLPPAESISSTLVSSTRESPDNASDSDSDSDGSESSSDASSDAGDDSDSDPSQHLAALLQRAKGAARARALAQAASGKRGGDGDGLAGNSEVVLFGDEDDDDDDHDSDDVKEGGSTPRASTSRTLPPSLARPLSHSHPLLSSLPSRAPRTGGISLSQDVGGVLADAGATRVQRAASDAAGKDKGKGKEVDRWGQAPLPHLSKKQLKAKQPHTAGAAWFDMPATPMTPELKRELDALRLSQSLDPKRFMRGGAKRDKVGEFFQIGHIIAPTTRATTQSSAPRAQKRSFVEDLIEDDEARAYARKKTKEVLAKGMSGRKRQRKGGRGAFAMGAGGKK